MLKRMKEHIAVTPAEIQAANFDAHQMRDARLMAHYFFREKLRIELPHDAEITSEFDTLSSGLILYASWLAPEDHGNGD
jgi:hypothetical protein